MTVRVTQKYKNKIMQNVAEDEGGAIYTGIIEHIQIL